MYANNLFIQGDAQEPPATRRAPGPQQEELSHSACQFRTSRGSVGSSEEKGVVEEPATRVREEQERVSPHQDVKAGSAAVITSIRKH